ncbi:MAG: hypothetical protein R2795_17010 [Saprospiraceae bacterium]
MESTTENKIKKLVSESKTSDALALLLELSKPNKQVHDAIHIILGEFNELTSQRLRGTIDNSEATKRINIIHDKILIAINSFDSQGKPLPNSVISGSGKTTKFLLKLALFILGCAIILTVIAYVLKEGNGFLFTMLAAYYVGAAGLIVLGGWFVVLLFNALKGK